MREKHQKECRNLNYSQFFLIFISAASGCASISAFAVLVGDSVGITSSATGIKICAVTAAIKRFKSIIKKKRGKYDHIVLLAKSKINTIEILLCKALSDLYINHDEFFFSE